MYKKSKIPIVDLTWRFSNISFNNKFGNLDSNTNIPAANLSNIRISKKVIKMISREICEKYKIIPIKKKKNILLIAISHPFLVSVPGFISLLEEIKDRSKCEVEIVLGSMNEIKKLIEKYYRSEYL